MSDVLVLGCGLLGTSLALALRESDFSDVTLVDADEQHVQAAVALGAGRRWDGVERAGVVVAAVPPAVTASALIGLQRRDVGRTYTHLCSVQSHVQAEIEASSPDPSRVAGGHPLAGREVTGPEGAVADLFVGRPWALCPGPSTAPDALATVRALAEAAAAVPVEVAPDAHDRAVALLSHLPQVASSALAAQLVASSSGLELPVALAGPGLVDTTRLAAGDADLWTDILSANATHVAPLVAGLAESLTDLGSALQRIASGDTTAAAEVRGLLVLGNAGRATVPVKRGELAGAFGRVRVVLPDRPGELGRLLRSAGDAGVNVEDVHVEHVPGRPTGLVDLLVDTGEQRRLAAVLREAEWQLI